MCDLHHPARKVIRDSDVQHAPSAVRENVNEMPTHVGRVPGAVQRAAFAALNRDRQEGSVVFITVPALQCSTRVLHCVRDTTGKFSMHLRLKNLFTPPEAKASRTAKLLAFESGRRARWTPRDYAALAREGCRPCGAVGARQ